MLCFVNYCVSFWSFYFAHYFVCPSSIYGFWLPLWYLRFTASDYPFGIFKLFFWPRLMLSIQKPNKIYIAYFQSILRSLFIDVKSLNIFYRISWYTHCHHHIINFNLLPEHLCSHSVVSGVRVAQAFCVVLCRSLFLSICCFFIWPLYCLSFLRPLITNLPSSNNFLHYLTFFQILRRIKHIWINFMY